MSSLILAGKRPEIGTPNVEREYRHFSFFPLPFLVSIFLALASQKVLLQERRQQLWKMPRAKTLMEGRVLSCPLSVAAVSKPHCFSHFIFYIFIPVGPECGWHHRSASRSMVWGFHWRLHLEHMWSLEAEVLGRS